MIARWLFLAVLAVVLPARAQITAAGPMATQMGSAYVVSYASNGTPIAAAARSITATGGEALIRDMFNVSGPAGNLGVSVARTATAADIALGLARVASKLAVPLTVGMLAYDMLGSVGVRQGQSGAEIDPGADPGTRDVFKVGTKTGTTKPSACTAYAASVYIGEEEWFQAGYPVRANYKPVGYVGFQGQTEVCIVDGYNHLNELTQPGFRVENFSTTTEPAPCTEGATGASMSRVDGKCPTGRYEAATEAQAQAKLLPVAQAQTVDAMKAAIAAGASIPSTSPQVAGPASQVGQSRTTTTTGPAGQTSTSVTPTYQYNYAGDTITYNTTNTTVTNITNPQGQTTTETKTEEQPKPQDTKQLCDTYPDSLACMKPGTPAEPDAVPVDRRTITITPDTARWQPNAGGCTRAAIQLVSGPTLDLWKPFCDFFYLIRGVVIGMFGIAGSFLFRNGIR